MSKIRFFDETLAELRACTLCSDLPLGAKPIFQIHTEAKILVAGQAPGRITHEKGRPFDDPSGERLRNWMGIEREVFYNPTKIAILPMGFCFPGTGASGDLPPRPECAQTWRERLLTLLPNIELNLVIGQYAMQWHFPEDKKTSLTEKVNNWQQNWPRVLPMPHPSPRNNRWLKNNPWFELDVLPALKERVAMLIDWRNAGANDWYYCGHSINLSPPRRMASPSFCSLFSKTSNFEIRPLLERT